MTHLAPLANLPLDHWAYETIDELRVRGLLPELFSHQRPYTRGEIAKALLSLHNSIKEGDTVLKRHELKLIQDLREEFRREMESLKAKETLFEYGGELGCILRRDGAFEWRANISPWADFDLKGNGAIYTRLKVDYNGEEDPDFRGKVWKDMLTGAFESGYLHYEWPHIGLLVGREKLLWGPGRRGALLLSDNSPSFDLMCLRCNLGSLRVGTFSTVLDPIKLETPIRRGGDTLREGTEIKRYLSGHRVDFKLGEVAEIGVSEMVLYGGPDRVPEAYYLNPLILYYASQFNLSGDDNILWDLDLSIRPFRNLEIYGEFLIDDFQYERKTPGDYEPPELGYLAGMFLCDPFGIEAASLKGEYMRVNAWTYNQRFPWNRYTNYGSLMGSWFGSDGDCLYLALSHSFDTVFRVTSSYELKRKGENDVDTPWPEGGVFPEDYFLTGTVETSHLGRVELTYTPATDLRVSLGLGHSWLYNREHVEGEDGKELRLSLDFSCRFDRALKL